MGMMPGSPQDLSRVLGNSGRVLSHSLHNSLPLYFTLAEMTQMQLNEYNKEQIHHKNEAKAISRHFWTNMESIYQIKYNLSSQVFQNGKSNSEDVMVRFGLKRIEETNEEDDDKSVESLEYFPLCPKTKHTKG
ncbi:unnamed protein product [Prunus brigantina]